jgi:hypothetical protein
MGTESQRTPFEEYRDFDLGFEKWNGCASGTTSRDSRMCNQDTPWRSSEEEDVDKTWSGDDGESSPGTSGESNPFIQD